MGKKNKKVPQSAGHTEKKKIPSAQDVNYSLMNPAWRFGIFDKDGPWGINNLKGITFHYSPEINKKVRELNDLRLESVLKSMDNRNFDNYNKFSNVLVSKCPNPIPLDLVKLIHESLSTTYLKDILIKLKGFEDMTWDKIDKQTHGKEGKSSNHNDKIEDLGVEARKRLKVLGYNDYTEIYSLRCGGLERIFGFRERNNLNILWVDINHSVYPPHKK